MDDSHSRQLLADFLREHEHELCVELSATYAHRYGYSKSIYIPEEAKLGWSRRVLREFAKDIEGVPNPHRYRRANAGDNVIQREDLAYPIFSYVETILFVARVIAPFIWKHCPDDNERALDLVECMERCIPPILKANMIDFADSCREPGRLSQYWNLCPNDDIEDDGALQLGIPATPEIQLSPREADILRLTSKGLSNKEIATELGIGLSTVKGYISRLFEKYGVRSRSALTSAAIRRKE